MSEIRVDLITEKTADGGVTIKSTGTGDNKPTLLTLQTSEADIAANDVLGKIQFQAPDEGTGTDAILVSAAIQARSEGDFAADANATAIDFMVGASEAAATKMSLSSTGVLTAVELDISGNVDVDGTTNLDVVDIDGALTQDGGAVFNEASADVDFRVESNGNTHMLFVDGGNNRVGIGTTPDLGVGLHIRTADSGMGSINANADELVIEGSGASGLSILSGASSKSNIFFGDSGSNVIGNISYNHSDNALEFATNGANQWFINSSGHLLPAATDHGIYLGVTSATASNLLDDYEEGTWTFGMNVGGVAISLSKSEGRYVKIGDLVHVQAYIVVSNLNSQTGALNGTGLPFAASNANSGYSSTCTGFSTGLSLPVHDGGDNASFSATFAVSVDKNATTMFLRRQGDSGGGHKETIACTQIPVNSEFMFQFSYTTF